MFIPGELATNTRILMGLGPSDVHPRVLKAMATPLVGHLDPQFQSRQPAAGGPAGDPG